jgi:hypothetical protein
MFEFVCRSTNHGSQALDRSGGSLVCVQQTLSLRSKGKQKSRHSQHHLPKRHDSVQAQPFLVRTRALLARCRAILRRFVLTDH